MIRAARDARRTLEAMARPAARFDAARYFRGAGDLGFFNVGTPAMRAPATGRSTLAGPNPSRGMSTNAGPRCGVRAARQAASISATIDSPDNAVAARFVTDATIGT